MATLPSHLADDRPIPHPRSQKSSLYVVREIPATLLRRNIRLSKAARELCTTMLSLADAKTGELRLPSGHWLDSRYISRQAEMGRDKFRRSRKELLAAGLIADKRPRIEIFQDGRRRNVLGESRYSVDLLKLKGLRESIIKNVDILLKPGFSTVEESGPHTSQTPPGCLGGGSSGVAENESQVGTLENHHPDPTPDDDSRESVRKPDAIEEETPNHIEKLQDEAVGTLSRLYQIDPEFSAEAIRVIDERAAARYTYPASSKYYIRSVINLLNNPNEKCVIEYTVKRHRQNRAKLNGISVEAWTPERLRQYGAKHTELSV
jgi:hypothetical protein